MAMTCANLNDIEREIPAPHANRNVHFGYAALQHDVDFRAFSKPTHTHTQYGFVCDLTIYHTIR